MDRIFIREGIEIKEVDLVEQWLEDEYALYKFEEWAASKGYKVK